MSMKVMEKRSDSREKAAESNVVGRQQLISSAGKAARRLAETQFTLANHAWS